ncbi:MAG TPA: ABC transporter ATP-binding protein [Mycobacteriales bacterium]|jgi:peptide/nickel transport system ATP-binding protein|nr:ABC transporter ATP-binding protein [Mycobacteriales bacterium]
MEPLLEVSDLTVKYRTITGDTTAVDNVDLTVNRGEILGIAGESGCGKSTMATSILRLLRPPGFVAGGSARFHTAKGSPVDLLEVEERQLSVLRWSELAYLPQGSMNSLNPVMRVRDQFVDVMQLHLGGDKKAIEDRIPDLLARVGLDPTVAHMYAHELSGGMKQRVIMALSVALEPDLLIADEPTTALDVTIQRVVIQNLAELRDKLGVAILVITHDMGVHAQLTDRVAVMYQGKIVEVGAVRQIFKKPEHEYTAKLISSIPSLEVISRTPPPEKKAETALPGVKSIVFDGVTQVFRGRAGLRVRAVDDVSFELRSEPAQVISLVGASGSGKSTIARIIMGLQKPSAGQVRYDGKDIVKLNRAGRDQFRRDVQPVFQDPYSIFNPFYRVDRVFWKAVKKFKLTKSREAGMEMIRSSLEAVKLDPDAVLGRYPHQLSGGQRQRLMLARVCLLRPSFIIADEPVSMLDAQVRKNFLDLLLEFQQKYGMTTLFITHDLSTVAYLGGQMMTMFRGQIVEKGPVSEVLTHPSHDYTKLLLASVPIPDPDDRWQDRVVITDGTPHVVEAPDQRTPTDH